MKCIERLLRTIVGIAAFAVLASACSGSSGDQVTQDPIPAEPGVAETPTTTDRPTVEAPTTTPEPDLEPLPEAEMIALATATFEANPNPDNLVAWDYLGSRVIGDRVVLELCAWDGETVFDSVLNINYTVEPTSDGPPRVQRTSSDAVLGDCLNTQLLDSAFAAIRAYDIYWSSVLEDPTTFDPEEASQYKTAELIELNVEDVAQWVRDGLHWEGISLDGQLPDSATVELVWRRYEQQGGILEIATCRDQLDHYGLYRDAELFDDFRPESPSGFEQFTNYQLSRIEGRWLLLGAPSNIYSDCQGFPSFVDGINTEFPTPTRWAVVPDA